MKNQLVQYLEYNNILIPQQSGFRQKHSCETALNMVIAEWKEELNKKHSIIAVFIDLKRAFETIDQKILLEKLEGIGIRDVELDWFRNFLTNRKQRTIIGSTLSEEVDVKIGLPQGSVLAPILFNIYINDINSVLKFSSIKLFADDALISINGNNENDIREKLQSDLNSLYIWLCANKLKINIDKTKYMVITRKNLAGLEPLKINNLEIENVKTIKYLGIQIDCKLKFDVHIDYAISKLATKLWFIQRTCKNLSKYYKIKVYRSIVEPYFIYCSTIFFIMKDSQIEKLQKFRIKPCASYYANVMILP